DPAAAPGGRSFRRECLTTNRKSCRQRLATARRRARIAHKGGTLAWVTGGRNRVTARVMVNDPTKTHADLYRPSIAGCLDGAIGPHGLSGAQLARWLDRLAPAIARLREDYRTGRLPHLTIAEETADIEEAEAAYARLARGARAVIFFGTGGSSLGGQTLAQLGGWHIPGTADEAQRKRPRTRFYDNLDGHTLASALHSFGDLGEVRF